MAAYSFQCLSCENLFETVKSVHEDFPDDLSCSDCGSVELKRVYSPNAVQFKSKGFYSYDNRKKPPAFEIEDHR